VPNLKLFVPQSPVTITQDQYYIYIGSSYQLLNTDVVGGKALLANTDQSRVVCKTLKPGTNVTMSANATQVTINAQAQTQINMMRLAGPDGTTYAAGGDSIALGTSAVANALDCIAIGDNADVTADNSVGAGKDAIVTGASSVALGTSSICRALNVAIGNSAVCGAATPLAVAVGQGAVADAASSIAFGAHTNCTAAGSVCINDGELSPATNATTNSCRFISDQYPVFEAFSDRAVHYGSQWHEYGNLHVLENFSSRGENPITAYWLSPNAQLYMPKMRNQDGSPAFEFVQDVNDSAMYGTAAGVGATAGVISGFVSGAAVGAGIGGFLLTGGTAIALVDTAAAVETTSLLAAETSAIVLGTSLSGGPVTLLIVGGVLVVIGTVITTTIVTAIVAAEVIRWATELYLEQNAVDWKFQLPSSWRLFGAEMGVETAADFPASAAWTFEVINKAGQYGKVIFKIEDKAYAHGDAFVEQRDGGQVQSWTNDSGEKQTIGISFVPHATLGYRVRYTVLTGAEGG